jgi:hypothetical protein
MNEPISEEIRNRLQQAREAISPEDRIRFAEKARLFQQINHTIGDREACAWLVAPGVVWIQVRLPELARVLRKRADTRQVVRSMAGGYLMTFEVLKGLAWADRWLARHHKPAQTSAGTKAEVEGNGTPTPPMTRPLS